MVLPKPYYGMYPAAAIRPPASLGDRRDNSPYWRRDNKDPNPYRDPQKVRQMISNYYGLVTEVDDWIGKVLKRLDELGLAENTLVIFTSDHGEMLGDHGMHSKMAFYEGAAHIPLLMRLPGVIPAGDGGQSPGGADRSVRHDSRLPRPGAATSRKAAASARWSRAATTARAISPFPNGTVRRCPGFMVCDGRWKLMFGQSAEAPSLDGLYDLQADPQEVANLIGRNPEWEKHRLEAERMKGLLVGWLARVKSPFLESVKARPIARQAELPKKKIRREKAPVPQ